MENNMEEGEIMESPRCLRVRQIRPVFEDVKVNGNDKKLFNGISLMNSHDLYDMFSYLSKETKEHFIVVHLDMRNRIVCIDTVSIGSMSSSVVHPREVFKSVLLSSAATIAIIHNHPSGEPDPSSDDIDITKQLKKAGDILGIPVIDHVIIGNGSYVSLFEKGLI